MEADARWRAIPGHEGFYEVSDDGRVRSVSREVRGARGTRRIQGRELRPHLTENGYHMVALSRAGFSRNAFVHRLVAMAFHGAPPWPRALVRHKDGNRARNTADNLAWGSDTENASDRVAHGNAPRGAAHPQARLTIEQVREIRASKDTSTSLARRFGVGVSTVSAVRSRQNWTGVE